MEKLADVARSVQTNAFRLGDLCDLKWACFSSQKKCILRADCELLRHHIELLTSGIASTWSFEALEGVDGSFGQLWVFSFGQDCLPAKLSNLIFVKGRLTLDEPLDTLTGAFMPLLSKALESLFLRSLTREHKYIQFLGLAIKLNIVPQGYCTMGDLSTRFSFVLRDGSIFVLPWMAYHHFRFLSHQDMQSLPPSSKSFLSSHRNHIMNKTPIITQTQNNNSTINTNCASDTIITAMNMNISSSSGPTLPNSLLPPLSSGPTPLYASSNAKKVAGDSGANVVVNSGSSRAGRVVFLAPFGLPAYLMQSSSLAQPFPFSAWEGMYCSSSLPRVSPPNVPETVCVDLFGQHYYYPSYLVFVNEGESQSRSPFDSTTASTPNSTSDPRPIPQIPLNESFEVIKNWTSASRDKSSRFGSSSQRATHTSRMQRSASNTPQPRTPYTPSLVPDPSPSLAPPPNPVSQLDEHVLTIGYGLPLQSLNRGSISTSLTPPEDILSYSRTSELEASFNAHILHGVDSLPSPWSPDILPPPTHVPQFVSPAMYLPLESDPIDLTGVPHYKTWKPLSPSSPSPSLPSATTTTSDPKRSSPDLLVSNPSRQNTAFTTFGAPSEKASTPMPHVFSDMLLILSAYIPQADSCLAPPPLDLAPLFTRLNMIKTDGMAAAIDFGTKSSDDNCFLNLFRSQDEAFNMATLLSPTFSESSLEALLSPSVLTSISAIEMPSHLKRLYLASLLATSTSSIDLLGPKPIATPCKEVVNAALSELSLSLPLLKASPPMTLSEYAQFVNKSSSKGSVIETNGPSCVDDFHPPGILVRQEGDYLVSTSPASLPYWDKCSFEPYSGKTDVRYIAFASPLLLQDSSLRLFLKDMDRIYDSHRLGDHIPLLNESSMPWDFESPFSPDLIAKYKSAVESTLVWNNERAHHDKNLWTIDLTCKTPSFVVYLVVPDDSYSSKATLRRLLVEFAEQLYAKLGKIALLFHFIPAEKLGIGASATSSDPYLHHVKTIAFSVVSQSRNITLPMTKFSTVKLNSVSSFSTPLFVLAPRFKFSPSLTGFGSLSPQRLPSVTLHCAYTFVADSNWLAAVWTDSQGALVESEVFHYQSHSPSSSVPLYLLYAMCVKTMLISRSTTTPWRLVFTCIGPLSEDKHCLWDLLFRSFRGDQNGFNGEDIARVLQENGLEASGTFFRGDEDGVSSFLDPLPSGFTFSSRSLCEWVSQKVSSISLVSFVYDSDFQFALPALWRSQTKLIETLPVLLSCPATSLSNSSTSHSSPNAVPKASCYLLSFEPANAFRFAYSSSVHFPSSLVVSLYNHIVSDSQHAQHEVDHPFNTRCDRNLIRHIAQQLYDLSYLCSHISQPVVRRSPLPVHVAILARVRSGLLSFLHQNSS